MKPKTMMMMLIAVGCGILAAIGSTFLGRGAAPANTVPVLVASRNLDAGMFIKDPTTMFVRKEFNKEQIPKDAVVEMDQLKGKMLSRTLSPNTIVTLAVLRENQAMQPPAGMRAVAVTANQEKTAGAFVFPGSRVDVIASRKGPNNRPIVRTILQNMQVLAVNQATEVPEGNKTIIPTTVTLAVKPNEVETLEGAKQTSTITLALRPLDDEKEIPLKPEESFVTVLVASRDIDANTTLDEPALYFESKEISEDKKKPGAIRDIEILKGKTVTTVINAESQITGKDLVGVKPEPKPKETTTQSAAAGEEFVQTIINGRLPEQKYTFKIVKSPSPPKPEGGSSEPKP